MRLTRVRTESEQEVLRPARQECYSASTLPAPPGYLPQESRDHNIAADVKSDVHFYSGSPLFCTDAYALGIGPSVDPS